jgi:hypothetical protein
MLDWVLRRDYKKWLRQRMRTSVDGDLVLVHRFEECGLRLRSGAVDFVGEQDVGENGTVFEFEALLSGGKDRDSDDVTGQHVTGELHTLKSAIDGTGDGLAECGFTNARDTFDEDVTFRENGDERKTEDVVFAPDDGLQGILKENGALQIRGCGLGHGIEPIVAGIRRVS